MKRVDVMIVDDDQDLAESLADLLAANGYQVEVASNGREAVERFREKDYGITFMDVRMPVMNGVDSFFEIRKMKPTARIVLMTGFKEPIVNKALAKNPDQRYQDGEQMARALHLCLQSLPSHRAAAHPAQATGS